MYITYVHVYIYIYSIWKGWPYMHRLARIVYVYVYVYVRMCVYVAWQELYMCMCVCMCMYVCIGWQELGHEKIYVKLIAFELAAKFSRPCSSP